MTYPNGRMSSHGNINFSSATKKELNLIERDSAGRYSTLTTAWLSCGQTDPGCSCPIICMLKFNSLTATNITAFPPDEKSAKPPGTYSGIKTLTPPAPGWSIKGFFSDSGLLLDRLGIIWGKDM